jgi:hypothetical protein
MPEEMSAPDPISLYRQRRATEASEVRRRIDEELAAHGLESRVSEARVATPAEQANAWMRSAINVARRRGTGTRPTERRPKEER